jgi:hypothetical protein
LFWYSYHASKGDKKMMFLYKGKEIMGVLVGEDWKVLNFVEESKNVCSERTI